MTILNEADNWLTRCLGPRGNSETDPWSWTRCFVAGEKEARGAWLFGHHKRPGSPRIKWVGLPDGMSLLDFKFAVVRGLNQLLIEDRLRGFRFELSLTEKDVRLWSVSAGMTLGGPESVSTFIGRVRTQDTFKRLSEVRELLDNKKLPLPDPHAASPGGVAAWSTGQSAVSAGGSLGPSALACDHLDPYASHRHLQRMSERGPGIAATVRENHVEVLKREMDRKLVVMSGLDDTWSGEKL